MKRWLIPMMLLLLAAAGRAQTDGRDAGVAVHPPQVSKHEKGRHVIQDVTLSTGSASYTLRYDCIELPDDKARIAHKMWAPSLGYTPLGIISPSGCLWYNQGFLTWTFDGFNIQDYRARFRVVRESGADAMVEYVWDTPKVTATARFAVTAGSDKLLFFGSYQPKTEIKECRLRLMSYPATFSKPWQRSVTTATRTLSEGSGIALDLAKERWVLLEDTLEGRQGDGSAGLLLGDTSAFRRVTLDGIGGYAEHVDLALAPGRRSFALGLYEFPGIPDPQATRAYFRKLADRECETLARIAGADPDKPLEALPTDAERVALIRNADEEALRRPAELWRPEAAPLRFPWAEKLPGPPVRAAILCPRWRAYETMELARRLEMDAEHLYFDGASTLTDPDYWPYRTQTGIGSLSTGVATRQGIRICTDETRDVILVTGLNAAAIPTRVREAILERVRSGKGLVLAGDGSACSGWPKGLFAAPDDALIAPVLATLPWEQIPGLREGERGRAGKDAPWKAYRYGAGRVVVFTARLGMYSSLVPLNDASEGLDGATDRILALHAAAVLAAAGRPFAARISLAASPVKAAVGVTLPASVAGEGVSDALVRVQDDCDTVLWQGAQKLVGAAPKLALPPLPAGRRYCVDVVARNSAGECIGIGGAAVEVIPGPAIQSLQLGPSRPPIPEAVPVVSLPDGGPLTCSAVVSPAPKGMILSVRWAVSDALGRVLARGTSPVGSDGRTHATLRLPRPVTVCHQVDTQLLASGVPVAVRRDRFTVPTAYPYDDFTFLLWSYPGGEPVIRKTNRACYDLGTDMMDLCHLRGYTDAGAARECALAARSGLRLVPYVTRVAGDAGDNHALKPGLLDARWNEGERASIQVSARQAAPYRPAAYTLGDENYLCHNTTEVCASPDTMAEFRRWLQERYKTIEALNAAWKTRHTGFEAITAPMWLADAAAQKESFAPWFDHRQFMDEAFARTHERLAEAVRKEDPGAKVGWDGLLGYHWQAGYDFHRLSQNLELNQVYTTEFPQGEMVRSFARPGTLTGEWGNAIADKEDGFSAIAWHHLFRGHNSSWWWTSWGCDYIPFNPDASLSHMGEWFFRAADEIRSGPGKLLVHAKRDDSRIAIWYSQADLYAATLAGKVAPGAAFADGGWLDDHRGLLRMLEDLGYQYRHVAAAEVAADPKVLSRYQVLFLPLATCLSDEQVAAIRGFVAAGGTVISDGRAGILTGNGALRNTRPLDDLFGVVSPAGLRAFAQPSRNVTLPVPTGEPLGVSLTEPGVTAGDGHVEVAHGETPILSMGALGTGRGVLINVPFRTYGGLRGTAKADMVLMGIGGPLQLAGVRPYSQLQTANGPARCIEQSLFTEGDLRYLALEQDILQPGLPAQAATVTLPRPAFVYDVRAGKPVGQGRTAGWDVTLSRGRPLLFALLPYQVTQVRAAAAPTAAPGETLAVSAKVDVSPGKAQFHVIRLDVYAPGTKRPHRQYSTSIECPAGQGKAEIPFALNDPVGNWRLELRDAATGVSTTLGVKVAPRAR